MQELRRDGLRHKVPHGSHGVPPKDSRLADRESNLFKEGEESLGREERTPDVSRAAQVAVQECQASCSARSEAECRKEYEGECEGSCGRHLCVEGHCRCPVYFSGDPMCKTVGPSLAAEAQEADG